MVVDAHCGIDTAAIVLRDSRNSLVYVVHYDGTSGMTAFAIWPAADSAPEMDCGCGSRSAA